MQFDEKWAFVRKKPKHCDPRDPADTEQGDNWDHVAFDPTHRLVLSVVPGKRTAVQTEALVKDAHMRTGGRMLDLLVSDAYPAYNVSSLPILEKGEHFPRVICIHATFCSHYKTNLLMKIILYTYY
jgi:hypothetical protein